MGNERGRTAFFTGLCHICFAGRNRMDGTGICEECAEAFKDESEEKLSNINDR